MRPPTAILEEALHHHAAGRLEAALQALEAIPAGDPVLPPVWTATELERRTAAPGSPFTVSATVRDWVERARDRLRRDLGGDAPAVVPVELPLRSALALLTECR